jgi:hypothetical protein
MNIKICAFIHWIRLLNFVTENSQLHRNTHTSERNSLNFMYAVRDIPFTQSHCLFAFHLFTTLFCLVTTYLVSVDKSGGGFEFQARVTQCVICSSHTNCNNKYLVTLQRSHRQVCLFAQLILVCCAICWYYWVGMLVTWVLSDLRHKTGRNYFLLFVWPTQRTARQRFNITKSHAYAVLKAIHVRYRPAAVQRSDCRWCEKRELQGSAGKYNEPMESCNNAI